MRFFRSCLRHFHVSRAGLATAIVSQLLLVTALAVRCARAHPVLTAALIACRAGVAAGWYLASVEPCRSWLPLPRPTRHSANTFAARVAACAWLYGASAMLLWAVLRNVRMGVVAQLAVLAACLGGSALVRATCAGLTLWHPQWFCGTAADEAAVLEQLRCCADTDAPPSAKVPQDRRASPVKRQKAWQHTLAAAAAAVSCALAAPEVSWPCAMALALAKQDQWRLLLAEGQSSREQVCSSHRRLLPVRTSRVLATMAVFHMLASLCCCADSYTDQCSICSVHLIARMQPGKS